MKHVNHILRIVINSIKGLKSDKSYDSTEFSSDSLINGTHVLLNVYLEDKMEF